MNKNFECTQSFIRNIKESPIQDEDYGVSSGRLNMPIYERIGMELGHEQFQTNCNTYALICTTIFVTYQHPNRCCHKAHCSW